MIPTATARKVGLLKIALALCEIEQAPLWKIKDPVRTFQAISRDESMEFRVDLEHRSWTTANEIFESYFSAAERFLDLDDDLRWVIDSSRDLLKDLHSNFNRFRMEVDWAAKREMLTQYMEAEGTDWRDPSLRAFDLEYHNADPDEGLHAALVEMGEVVADPDAVELEACLKSVREQTRAFARGLAISRFNSHLLGVSWRTLTFSVDGSPLEIDLAPDVEYPPQLAEANDVGTFINMLREVLDDRRR